MAVRKPTTKIIRSLRSGQVTLPAEFRKKLGITEDTMLEVSLEGQELRIRPLRVRRDAPGSPWLKDLYDHFAPVRQEAEERGYSEEEIDAAIDAAVRAVRSKHA